MYLTSALTAPASLLPAEAVRASRHAAQSQLVCSVIAKSDTCRAQSRLVKPDRPRSDHGLQPVATSHWLTVHACRSLPPTQSSDGEPRSASGLLYRICSRCEGSICKYGGHTRGRVGKSGVEHVFPREGGPVVEEASVVLGRRMLLAPGRHTILILPANLHG